MTKFNIGLLGLDDPADTTSYSGTPYHVLHFLRKAGHQVRPLGPYPIKGSWLTGLHNRISKAVTGRHIIWSRHSLIAGQYGPIVDSYAKRNPDLDFLLATSGFYIANAKTKKPLIFWGDSTAAGMIDKYDYYTGLSKRMIDRCHAADQAALDTCSLAIFSSQWAVDVALQNYRVDPQKVHFIPYGANLVEAPSEAEIPRIIARRSASEVRVLLVGIDWRRKGVDKAIDVVSHLRQMGFDASLTVVGCSAPSGRVVPDFVRVLGRISKASAQGRAKLASLFCESHLFILPTVAECASVALAEASAFGIPVLASDVGGNGSLVENGVNGFLLALEESPAYWAEYGARMVGDRRNEFALSAYRHFKANLSYEVGVAKLERVVSSHLAGISSSESLAYEQLAADDARSEPAR